MSINLMSAIFRTQFRDLQDDAGNTTKASTAKFVCIALADHANDEGEGAYPSIGKLSYKTSLSRTAVINALDALKYNGILTANGTSKWDTVNYTVNSACFSQDSQPALLVNPLDSPQSTHLTPPVIPVDPNHPLTIHKPNNEILTAKELEQVNAKVESIIGQARESQSRIDAGTGWRGRELLPAQYVAYGDWWYAKTGLHMYGAKAKAKVDSGWLKAFKELYENDVTIASLDEAMKSNEWRTISNPAQIVNDAKAIQAAPKSVQSSQRPEGESSGYYA